MHVRDMPGGPVQYCLYSYGEQRLPDLHKSSFAQRLHKRRKGGQPEQLRIGVRTGLLERRLQLRCVRHVVLPGG